MSLFGWTLLPLIILHLWLFRRHRAVFHFQLLLDVIVATIVGPALVVSGDLNPVTTIKGSPPFRHVEWSESAGYQPTQGDLVYQFHPWWDEAGRQMRRREFPAIQPGVGGGLPLMANGQTGIWAPMMAPVWLHGPERGTTIMAFWKIESAGLGAFLFFATALRLRWRAAAVGGVAWAGAPYLVGWLLVPLAWTVAALPWTWWVAWWIGRRQVSIRGTVLVGLGFGWLMGAGLHPESAAIVCGSALLALLCCHPRRWWRVVVIAGTAGLTALALAWPTVGYIQASSRHALGADAGANLEGMPRSVQSDLARQIISPASVGHPGRGDWRPKYPHAPGAAGVGGVVLALLASGRPRNRHRRWVIAAGASALLGLTLLLRIPPIDSLLVRIPPLDQMTLPRFGVLIPWGVIVLAVLALDGAMRGRARLLPVRLLPAVGLAIAATWAAPGSLAPVDAALVATSVGLAGVAGIFGRGVLAPVLVTTELALLAVGINPVASTSDRLPTPPLVERLVELETEEPTRIVGLGRAFLPNLASRYGLRDLRAFGPLRPSTFARLMGVLGEPATILGGPLQRLPAGLCGAWGVGLAVTPPGRELDGWQREYRDRDGAIWSNPRVLPEVRVVGRVVEEPEDISHLFELARAIDFETTALVSGGEAVGAEAVNIELWRRAPTLIELNAECDGPCLVFAAQAWAPGWQASVDGKREELVRTNVAGIGAVVPAGRHSVAFEYRPWSWRFALP